MSNNPHDESGEKTRPEKVVTIRCGSCVRKITAPPSKLAEVYALHEAWCGAPR